MKTNELNEVWGNIENLTCSEDHFFQRMICVDLLYRVYAGASGIPSKRFVSIEIPAGKERQFSTFTEPRGFTLTISEPSVKNDGYMSCVLQAAASDQNDVFAIVAKDIIHELYKQDKTEDYVHILKTRIEKWRNFFKNADKKQLSDEIVIGLIGELSFIKDLIEAGIHNASDFWNGPIKAAQDFQGEFLAAEIKTSSSNQMNYVRISSEVQLDGDEKRALFLVVYRVERNDTTGKKLPELIQEVSTLLAEQQKSRFFANLRCLGYEEDDKLLYTKAYSVKERAVYEVKDDFPRLLRKNLPQGITDIKYKLCLQNCTEFKADMETIVKAVKEFENGQN